MEKYILLIDGDKKELPVFLEALTQVPDHYSCMHAADIVQAAKMATSLHPAAIFLDYNITGINGKDCLEAINKTEGLKNIPLYLYSAGLNSKIIRNAYSLGARAFFNKTCNVKLLAAILKKLLL